MSERPRIPAYLIEDNELYISDMVEMLEQSQVVTLQAQAVTREQAEQLISDLPATEPVVVVLDYNLTEDGTSGNDGKELQALIRSHNPDAIIVSSSNSGLPGKEVDFQLKNKYGGTKYMEPQKFDEAVALALQKRGLRQ